MPSYDDHLFSPPAPIARVVLRNSEKGNSIADVPMLIDSGADVTLIPQSFIDILQLELGSDESYELIGFDGSKSISMAVYLDLIFLRRTFKGRFLLINQDYGILGRDILNHVSLILDGPQLIWNENR